MGVCCLGKAEPLRKAFETLSAGVVVRQENGRHKVFLFPGVATPREGVLESAGGSEERPAPGLRDEEVEKFGQVFGGFPVFIAGREILGDDFGNPVFVEEHRLFS